MKKIIIMTVLGMLLLLPAQVMAAPSTDEINQKVCNRFEEDLNRLAAIMEEVRRRQGIKETRVAFGQVDTPIENADYWITYAAEAIAFQRAQKYTGNSQLKSSLNILAGKVLRAKNEAGKVLK